MLGFGGFDFSWKAELRLVFPLEGAAVIANDERVHAMTA